MLAEIVFEKIDLGKQFRVWNILHINRHKKLPRISAIEPSVQIILCTILVNSKVNYEKLFHILDSVVIIY